MVSRDSFKELLVDTLGIGDREWSRRLGRASLALTHHTLTLLTRTGGPFLMENAFRATDRTLARVRWRS